MKKKQIVKVSLLTFGALVLAIVGGLAWFITPGLRTPARVPAPDYWPTHGWQSSSPEAQGFDSEKLAAGLQDIQDKQMNIDSLIIIRNGYVILDARFDPYDGSFPHDLASVTKSVTTTLIAIAAEQGKLDLDQPVISFFPERKIANLDDRKSRMTVRHLAGMVNGMQSGCYKGDQETIQAMMAGSDWVQAALDRPMVSEPGTEFCYDSPGMHLLSAILQKTTGMTALDFALHNLFEPLGIQEATWESDPQGISRGWGDLHLLPEDAAKIGFLWLQRGEWDGKQIVPEAWVLDSVRPHSKFIEPDFGYGYGWWIAYGDYQASGRGGQKVRVMAFKNLIVATTGGNFEYGDIESWLTPLIIQADGPRPENPEGLAALDKALASVRQKSAVPAAASPAELVQAISGQTYRCENNAAGVESLIMDFSHPDLTSWDLKLTDRDLNWPIGLDGTYRISPEGSGLRGYWKDPQTFLVEIFDVGIATRQMQIDGDRLQFSLPDVGLTFTCQIQQP